MKASEAKEILERYRNGSCTAEEVKLIEQWHEQLEETGDFEWMQGEKEHYAAMIRESIMQGIKENGNVHKGKRKIVRMWRWVAAACIVLAVGVLANVWWKHNDKTPQQVAITHDVPAPKETRAVITLANGQKVYLDSANNGTIAQENNVNVVKNEEGEIIYSHEGTKTQSEIAYNTLSNPRGSKVISLTLSDGTKVWLNSESSLKYPIAFNASTREVEITGEAYFEVKHNSKQPFKVHLPNGSIVEDIGTAFNVNAYADEDNIKTTLIEGSVRISANSQQLTANSQSIVLKPNQQASIHDSRFTIDHPDVDEVMAWKNGVFSFNNTDLRNVMRQIARWYDVDVEYQGTIPAKVFVGEIDRTVPVSKVLQMMEYVGVKFKIEGKKITVMK